MKLPELWEKNTLYTVLRKWVDWCTRRSFRTLRTEGSLPEGGVLVTPNHTNTLMDALVVLQTVPGPIGFGARADIFHNRTAAYWLHRCRMVPLTRERDGLREVARNLEVMPKILDVLAHDVPFCIFPEGRHQPKHSLLPLHKGVTRIALQNLDAGRRTLVVPVGIDYSDFFRYRGECVIRYGAPLDLGAFVQAHADMSQAELYQAFAASLSDAIKSLILYIPDDGNYERRLSELRPPKPRRWWEIPLAVLLLPLFLVCALLSLPQWGIAEYICHCKIKDAAFRNTVRFAMRLAGTPVMLLVWTVAGFALLPPLAAAGLLLCYAFSYSFFYDWLNLARIKY